MMIASNIIYNTKCYKNGYRKEELIFLSPVWKGERFKNGRPKVSDALYLQSRC